ncbi:MAG: L,D-transpeptidase [Chthoniobacteraceae bacterium]
MRLTAFPCHFAITVLVLCAMRDRAAAQSDAAPVDVIISVHDQKMLVLREGGWVKKYKISTSRFGLGDAFGSYKTPLGRLRVWEKVGGALPSGAVLKGRAATGEILGANAPGRDPIVSRILWLEGLESQNDNARGRGIYIHGTTEEAHLGKPVSWGCVRMRSEDVIELYDIMPLGAMVTITEGGLPHFAKWKAGPPVMIAAQTATVEPSRSLTERMPAVAELLKPSSARMARADAGAANAFRGSILFSGLPAASSPAKSELKAAARTDTPLPGEAFTLAAVSVSEEAVSLRVTTAIPPLALLDLRRTALSPLLLSASILNAPIPAFAYADKIGGETTMSAVSRPARTPLH